MINTFISKFTNEKFEFIEIDNNYFLANKDILEFSTKDCLMIGLPMGKVVKNKFKPSLALLSLLNQCSNEKVIVKDIGEIDFIYGKDLKARCVERIVGEDKKGFLKLIVNKNDECLGYGKIVGNLEGGKVVKSLLDIGDFLRREK